MCDTLLARPEQTSAGVMLFGKNSDRQRNEAHVVECFARAEYPANASVACTYISIPQVRHTHATLLCRPFWIWGAEMGANEHGVVIGNEAVRARGPAPETQALIGMDLLRLALERASTAEEAVRVITTLLEEYGQGGNCGHITSSYYHNGFAIADARDAFILETIGREWMVERVRTVRAISNAYSIGRDAETCSPGLRVLLRTSGWSDQENPSYADALTDPSWQHLAGASARRARGTALMASRAGELSVADMMNILRDHGSGERDGSPWTATCVTAGSLCMHAGDDTRPGQTVGAMVSEVYERGAVHWVTATAAPCISIFKPLLIGTPLPEHGPRCTDRFDREALWWKHQCLYRQSLLRNFPAFITTISDEQRELEARFQTRIREVFNGGNTADRLHVITRCWQEAAAVEDRWFTLLSSLPPVEPPTFAHTWEKMNALAGLNSA